MIDYIKGPIVYKEEDRFVIECGGVGFSVLSTLFSLEELEEGTERTVFTELVVREDAMILVGFSTRAELEVYRMLVTVNGVGPRTALSALSSIRYVDLCAAIVARDVKTIQKAQGIGKKTAERIAVDLSDKAGMIAISGISENAWRNPGSNAAEIDAEDEVLGALLSLGYRRADALQMLARVDREGLSAEEALRRVLQNTL